MSSNQNNLSQKLTNEILLPDVIQQRIDIEEFFPNIVVGSSQQNAFVQEFYHVPTSTKVAIKRINIPTGKFAKYHPTKKWHLQALQNEVEIHKILSDDRDLTDLLKPISNKDVIVEFYGSLVSKGRPNQLWICMESMLCSIGEIVKLLLYTGRIEIHQLLLANATAFSMLNALAYCNYKKILHFDVKPDNILVNSKGQIKLSDFGTSIFAGNISAQLKNLWIYIALGISFLLFSSI